MPAKHAEFLKPSKPVLRGGAYERSANSKLYALEHRHKHVFAHASFAAAVTSGISNHQVGTSHCPLNNSVDVNVGRMHKFVRCPHQDVVCPIICQNVSRGYGIDLNTSLSNLFRIPPVQVLRLRNTPGIATSRTFDEGDIGHPNSRSKPTSTSCRPRTCKQLSICEAWGEPRPTVRRILLISFLLEFSGPAMAEGVLDFDGFEIPAVPTLQGFPQAMPLPSHRGRRAQPIVRHTRAPSSDTFRSDHPRRGVSHPLMRLRRTANSRVGFRGFGLRQQQGSWIMALSWPLLLRRLLPSPPSRWTSCAPHGLAWIFWTFCARCGKPSVWTSRPNMIKIQRLVTNVSASLPAASHPLASATVVDVSGMHPSMRLWLHAQVSSAHVMLHFRSLLTVLATLRGCLMVVFLAGMGGLLLRAHCRFQSVWQSWTVIGPRGFRAPWWSFISARQTLRLGASLFT